MYDNAYDVLIIINYSEPCHVHLNADFFQAINCFRSRDGELVFPDIPHDESMGVTIEASRRQHQRNYLNMELELVEGYYVTDI